MKSIALLAFGLMLCIVVFRNPIAKFAAVKIASSALGGHVEIDRLELGLSRIRLSGVHVAEPGREDLPQIEWKSLDVQPTILRGLRTGVWLNKVEVVEPVLHLRFDAAGNLISTFPAKGESEEETGPLTIPVKSVSVRKARLVVHQIGREDFEIRDVEFLADCDQQIIGKLSVPDFLGAKIECSCLLSSETFAGSSQLRIDDLQISTSKLAKLPFVPEGLAQDNVQCHVSVDLRAAHPPSDFDLRNHDIDGVVRVRKVTSQQLGALCQECNLTVNTREGRLQVHADGKPLKGRFEVNAQADLNKEDMHVSVSGILNGLCIEDVERPPSILAPCSGQMGLTFRGEANVKDDGIHFSTRTMINLDGLAFEGYTFPELTVSATSNGVQSLAIADGVSGVLAVELISKAFDISDNLRRLDVPDASGFVAAKCGLSVPLESLADPKALTVSGNVSGENISLYGLTIDDCTIDASMSAGQVIAKTSPLMVRDPESAVVLEMLASVNANLQTWVAGELKGQTSVVFEPTIGFSQSLGIEALGLSGRVESTLGAECTIANISAPNRWTIATELAGKSIQICGESLSDFSATGSLANGYLKSSPLVIRWNHSELVLTADGQLSESAFVAGSMKAQSIQIADLARVASRFSGTPLPASGLASIDGRVRFNVNPSVLDASGIAKIQQVDFGGTRIGNAVLEWQAGLGGLEITSKSNDFLGGRYQAVATLNELDWTQTKVRGSFDRVQFAKLVGLSKQKLASAGGFAGAFEIDSIASLETLRGHATVTGQGLSLHRVPMELRDFSVSIAGGQASLTSDGNLAGGNFSISALCRIPQLVRFLTEEPSRFEQIPVTGKAKVVGVQLAELLRSFGLENEARQTSGSLSFDCVRESSAWDGRHLCLASAAIVDMRFRNRMLSNRMSMDAVVRSTDLELVSVDGRLADGQLSGTAAVNFSSTPKGWFDLRASRINLRRAVAPLGVEGISGSSTVKVSGRIGPVIQGNATVLVDHAVAAGMDIRKASFPVDFSASLASAMVRWQCRAGHISAGGGSIRLACEGSYQSSLSFNSTVRVEKIDLEKLMQGGSVGSGIVTGEAVLRGKAVTSPRHLVGNYKFQIENIKALEFPVLDQLPSMISLSPSIPGKGKDGGSLRGRIAGGLVFVDELAIYKSNVQVLVEGNATMDGRLDLDIIASTESTGPADQLMSLVDSPLMLAAPAPITLVVKANDFLKDRVVRIHAGGTASRPTLRLQPGKQMSQQAIQFFLKGSLGIDTDRLTETGTGIGVSRR